MKYLEKKPCLQVPCRFFTVVLLLCYVPITITVCRKQKANMTWCRLAINSQISKSYKCGSSITTYNVLHESVIRKMPGKSWKAVPQLNLALREILLEWLDLVHGIGEDSWLICRCFRKELRDWIREKRKKKKLTAEKRKSFHRKSLKWCLCWGKRGNNTVWSILLHWRRGSAGVQVKYKQQVTYPKCCTGITQQQDQR